MCKLIHTELYEFDEKKYQINVYRSQGPISPQKDTFYPEVILNGKPIDIVKQGIVLEVIVKLFKSSPEEIEKNAIEYVINETKKEIINKSK